MVERSCLFSSCRLKRTILALIWMGFVPSLIPCNVWAQDFVLPDVELESLPQQSEADAQVNATDSSRSVAHGLGMKKNVRVLESTGAGQPVSILGTRRAAEEVDVQGLGGVSLSPPQGGGFDFSQYPSLLWDSMSWTESFASGKNRDLKSFAATAQLKTWSENWIQDEGGGREGDPKLKSFSAQRTHSSPVSGMQSDGVVGLAAPGQWGGQIAWGYGAQDGVGAIFGARSNWQGADIASVEWGVLGARMRALDPGSRSFPTPETERFTRVVAPVIRMKGEGSRKWLLSFQGLWNEVDFDSPEYSIFSKDLSHQLGTEIDLKLTKSWDVSAFLRRAQLSQESLGVESPAEESFGVTLAYRSEGEKAETLQWRGSVDLAASRLLGVHPSATVLGAYRPDQHGQGRFEGELGFQSRFPSLLDRYYSIPGVYAGNPDLLPEQGLRSSLGWEVPSFLSLKGFVEKRARALYRSGFEAPRNLGGADLYGVEGDLEFQSQTAPILFNLGGRWTQSKVGTDQTPFPYLPKIQATGAIRFLGKNKGATNWGSALEAAFQSTRVSGTGVQLSPFLLWDATFWYKWTPSIRSGVTGLGATFRVENLMNEREVELVADYPLPGRTLSLALRGDLDF